MKKYANKETQQSTDSPKAPKKQIETIECNKQVR